MAAFYPSTTPLFSAICANIGTTGTEGDVNGVWNAILHTYFGTFAHAIKAEAEAVDSITNIRKGWIDLLVTRQVFVTTDPKSVSFPWAIVFEGKGPSGDNWTKVRVSLIFQ